MISMNLVYFYTYPKLTSSFLFYKSKRANEKNTPKVRSISMRLIVCKKINYLIISLLK